MAYEKAMSPAKKPLNTLPKLPDSTASWWEKYIPGDIMPWILLMRLDRPVGIWLLFLPCLVGLFWGWTGDPFQFPIVEAVLFFLGAIVMRSAGCVFNDWVDRDLDAKVERTKNRPLAANIIKPSSALICAMVLSLIGAVILMQLPPTAIFIGIGAIPMVALYPFMKRITRWPQLWLGLTFNWGFLVAFATMTETLTLPSLMLYFGLVAWTFGYDTIYALQDREDDAIIGIGSSALSLGPKVTLGIALSYCLCVFLIGTGLLWTQAHPISLLMLLGLGVHFYHQTKTLWDKDEIAPDLALKLFRSNREAGLLLVGIVFLGPLMAEIFS